MGHVFISYSPANKAYVQTLSIDMRRRGFDVWMDERVDYGSTWTEVIIEAIETCSAFVVVITPESNRSEWVERETTLAQREGKPMLPLLLEGRQFPQTLGIHPADVTGGNMPDEAFYAQLAQIVRPRARTGMLVTPPEVQVRRILAEDSQPPARPTSPRPPQRSRQLPVVGLVALFVVLGLLVGGGILILASRETTLLQTLEHARTYSGSNRDWDYYLETFEGVEMMLVPAGCFMMTVHDAAIEAGVTEREECLEPFWIDRTEVTNAIFEQLEGDAASPPAWPGPRLPREQISWAEARAFCTARGGDLPSEAQWAYASRGPAGFLYPWGDTFQSENVAYAGNTDAKPAPVGDHPDGDSWIGALDISGNVWEWVADSYVAEDGTIQRVARGGAWNTRSMTDLQGTAWQALDPDHRANDLGFRCMLPVE